MSFDIVESLFSVAPHLRDGSIATSSYVLIRCPFHGGGHEKTPSMGVSREKPLYHCYACHASGHISQLMRHFGASREAIDIYLAQAHLNVRYEKGKAGKVGAKILLGEDPFRGKFILDDEIIDRYRLAPKILLEAGYGKQTLRHFEVGFDRENLRITYPLRNLYGDLVGISGRTIVGIEPRYKIYTKELIARKDFNVPTSYSMDAVKEAILWHAHIIRPILFHEDGNIIVTEGFKAAMWTWQAGYQNVTALIGSSLTEHHSEILATYSAKEVFLFLDNNEAGIKGTYYAAKRLEEKGMIPRIVHYPDHRQQPDDLEPAEIDQAFNNAYSFKEWRKENQHVSDEASRRHRPRW